METKTCNKCHETKDVNDFHKNSASKDGRVSSCKHCTKIYDREFWLVPEPKEKVVATLPKPDNAKFENGVVTVTCKNCGKRFVPTRGQILSRKDAWNNLGHGESNFYCSDDCKYACPLYNHHTNSIDPKSSQYVEKPKQKKARACQTNHLKQLQIDETGHTYCEKCGKIGTKESPMHLHHTLPVAQYGDDAINSAGHIILCKDCHNEIHKQCKTK